MHSEDAAFVLGRGGSTKQKIARVCGAELDLNERENKITIHGTRKQRKAAREYISYVMQQRTGSVSIELDDVRDDLTVVKVPEDCVAFIMGKGGQTLRSMELEWQTLMFFSKVPGQGDRELLMIFGTIRARRGAEMKVLHAQSSHRIGEPQQPASPCSWRDPPATEPILVSPLFSLRPWRRSCLRSSTRPPAPSSAPASSSCRSASRGMSRLATGMSSTICSRATTSRERVRARARA